MTAAMNDELRRLSVVIPTFDEEDTVPRLLEDLRRQRGVDLEIIVVDGGSSDHTVELARARTDIVIESDRGRGFQMNLGAFEASASTLLFLHADTRLPHEDVILNALEAFETRLDQLGHENLAAHFPLLFRGPDRDEREGYRYLERKTELNRKNTTNGDQGLMIRQSFFDRIGRFEESLPFLEDQRIAETIRRRGEWMTLPEHVVTSTRRFAVEGFDRRYMVMSIIMGCFDAGIDNFFDHVEDAYAVQTDVELLDMMPVFEAVRRTLAERGTVGTVVTWYEVGRFIRENAWQLFFFWDVMLEEEWDTPQPCLDFYDRRVEPWLDGPFFNALTGLLSANAFMVAFPAYYWAKDSMVPALKRQRDEWIS